VSLTKSRKNSQAKPIFLRNYNKTKHLQKTRLGSLLAFPQKRTLPQPSHRVMFQRPVSKCSLTTEYRISRLAVSAGRALRQGVCLDAGWLLAGAAMSDGGWNPRSQKSAVRVSRGRTRRDACESSACNAKRRGLKWVSQTILSPPSDHIRNNRDPSGSPQPRLLNLKELSK
jgi:hypothetical protein